MDKEKQIKEMHEIMKQAYETKCKGRFCNGCKFAKKDGIYCGYYLEANALYEAGYRKVGNIEDNFISKKALIAGQNNKTATEHFLMAEKVIEQAKKETEKEILQTLYNNLKKQPQFFKVYIETLSAKYGVEIEKMTDKEQIELEILLINEAENYCDSDGAIIIGELAETLYNAGYRKVYPIKLCNGTDFELTDKDFEKERACEDCQAKVRKETAKEILDTIFELFPKDKTMTYISTRTLKKLCKKYGVNIESDNE